MKLYTRPGSARLYADITDPTTGKRIRWSTGETERRAAMRAALARVAALQAERGGGLPVITIWDALARYLAHVQGKASAKNLMALSSKLTGTHPASEMAGRWHLDSARPLHTVCPGDLDELVRARTAEGNGAQTIAHELKLLRTATRHAAGLGYAVPPLLTGGAVRNAWRVPTLPRKTRYLSLGEYARLFAFMDPRKPIETTTRYGAAAASYIPEGQRLRDRQDAQDLLVALALTGGRWTEMARMTWAQVNLADGLARLWGNKTGKERLVPLPAPALVMLRRRYAERDPEVAAVFPGEGGGFRGSSSCKPILRAMTAMGLNDPVSVARHGKATVHSLRHTFASLLLQRGAGMADLQAALGHSSPATTHRYAHLDAGRSVAKLGALLTEALSTHE